MFEPHLGAKEVAKLIDVTVGTLANWRVAGRGPKHRKWGRRVVYPESEVTKWMEASKIRASTSDVS